MTSLTDLQNDRKIETSTSKLPYSFETIPKYDMPKKQPTCSKTLGRNDNSAEMDILLKGTRENT